MSRKRAKKCKNAAVNPPDTWKKEAPQPGALETSNVVPDKRKPKKTKCDLKRNIRYVLWLVYVV
jgi:hypothetical protein